MSETCDLLCLDLPRAEVLRGARLGRDAAEAASRRFGALADATRLTLAATLAEGGELCGCDLAWVTERAQNLVSHHLRVLREEGLVSSRRDGKMVMHELTEAGRELVGVVLAQAASVR